MKSKCLECKKLMDEVEISQNYSISYQTEYCMECYGRKIADLVQFNRRFVRNAISRFVINLTKQLKKKNFASRILDKIVIKRIAQISSNVDFEKLFQGLWHDNRKEFDELVESIIQDVREDYE